MAAGQRHAGTAREPITVMADGTVKQIHPLSGTEVWTVPGRAHRPLPTVPAPTGTPAEREAACAFCHLDRTPPEKARMVRDGEAFTLLADPDPADLSATTPEFRRIPNLFEIVPFDYWRANHDLSPAPETVARHDRWTTSPAGRDLLLPVLRAKFLAAGGRPQEWDALPERQRLAPAMAFFAGGHDLILGRRHHTDPGTGAADPNGGSGGEPALAGSGTLTPQEHAAYVTLTVSAMQRLYEALPAARYVATFQNWLAPAGASFDHLHKQLVAIDEYGRHLERELTRLAVTPDAYARHLEYAERQGLVVARTEHAVAFAGFGHRYPTFEIVSLDPATRPFEQSEAQVRAMSDLLHALHAATGPQVPSNEEWHHRPRGIDVPVPWRIHLKWRVSTLAGFEGGTRIHLTTTTPWGLRDRALTRLHELRERGDLAPTVRLAEHAHDRA